MWLLRLVLRDRELDVIESGICDEYDIYIAPTYGPFRARLWFWNQTLRSIFDRRRDWKLSGKGASTGLLSDVKGAIRVSRKHLPSSVMIVTILAVAIGASTLLIGVTQKALFPELSFQQVDRLSFIWTRSRGATELDLVPPALTTVVSRAKSLNQVAFASRVTDDVLGSGEIVQSVSLADITQNFFTVLGVAPELGSLFGAGFAPETRVSEVALVVSAGVWVDLGLTDLPAPVTLSGLSAIVVGVAPASFDLPAPDEVREVTGADVWRVFEIDESLLFRNNGRLFDRDSDDRGVMVARLASEVTPETARAELANLEMPEGIGAADNFQFVLNSLRSDARSDFLALTSILWVAVTLVLIAASSNAGGLLLSRTLAREKEIAVRAALGATRLRLVQSQVVEGLLLAGLAAAIAISGVVLFGELAAGLLTLPYDNGGLGKSASLYGFIGTLLVVGVVAAVVPALRGTFIASNLTTRTASHRSRPGFLALQVSVSTLLLVAAISLVRTVNNLSNVDIGFESDGVVTFDAILRNRQNLRGPADRTRTVYEIERELSAMPGVEHVGLVGRLPFSGREWTQPFGEPGASFEEWLLNPPANFRVVTQGAFGALGIALLTGRSFDLADDNQDHRVVVIDEAMAHNLGGVLNAVGRFIGIPLDGEAVDAEVIGVVENVRYESLRKANRPTVYVPYRHEASRDVSVVIKGRGVDLPNAAVLRNLVGSVAPDVGVTRITTLASYVDRALAREKSVLAALSVFSLVTLALSLYGLIALGLQIVAQRRLEFGIRVALGAHHILLLREAVTPMARVGLTGVAVGTIGILALRPVISPMAFGVDPLAPGIVLTAVAGVVALVIVSAAVPAWRALQTDPIAALRAGDE